MHLPSNDRYQDMPYERCGRSGLRLPRISLGLWQNFGGHVPFENARDMVLRSFDRGITHFDLANNYGPPPGSAEEHFGRILAGDLAPYRDELIISTKAGYEMWPGPYGEWGSRKSLLASLDQSLERMGLEYVDIFYSHRYDPDTPLEETLGALDTAVRSGRALYVGISSYGPQKTREAAAILRQLRTPFVIHQPSYSMFNRWIESELLTVLAQEGLGCIAFSPLAQGLLTNKYLGGIPDASRAAENGSLQKSMVNEHNIANVHALDRIARERGQTLAQMAIAWVLRQPERSEGNPEKRQQRDAGQPERSGGNPEKRQQRDNRAASEGIPGSASGATTERPARESREAPAARRGTRDAGQPGVTSALIGASRWAQIEECLGALANVHFSQEELARIDQHASDGNLNIWAESSRHG